MDQLTSLYPNAVEHTKRKVLEDMEHYLAIQEVLPTFEQFLMDRKHYLDQIWINVWLNKVTNGVSKDEKKSYLQGIGYEVEGVDRKLLTKLFRVEMRKYHPFNVIEWLNSSDYLNQNKWEDQYEKFRKIYLKQEEERELLEKTARVKQRTLQIAQNLLRQNQTELYLHLRFYIAKQLVGDLQQKTKYQRIETFRIEEKLVEENHFEAADYKIVDEFLYELTGDIHKVSLDWEPRHYEYEMFYYVYERVVSDYLYDFVPKWIIENISSTFQNDFKKTVGEELSGDILKELIALPLYDFIEEAFVKIQKEYMSDLVVLAEIPFELAEHHEIYLNNLEDLKRRKEEELAEIERKKAEEERMLEDIFGREYSPPAGRNIRYILHIGDTNTGKTYQALERMKKAKSGLYLAPLRLLALEVYDKLNSEGFPCTLKTGEEEKVVPDARHISSTVEMFHEKDFYDVVVIDEAQMIADKDRGFSWYKAITKTNANEVHIIGSRNIKQMIIQLLGNSDIEIHEYERDTPLEVEQKNFKITHTNKGDALVCFSRRRVLEVAAHLQNNRHSVSMIYGSMPPETRKKQMQRFIKGETTVIVSTDAIGMGLNLPIRRIVFLENEKFDGTRRRRLTSQEVKQIAGRAGRKGLYNIGKVAFTDDSKRMSKLLEKEDVLISTFAIAPTSSVLERFQKYSRRLGTFFELWEKFESPKGTKKASLAEERELYRAIQDTEIEARLSISDLYGFLHLPFSPNDPGLLDQWRDTMYAIVNRQDLPEPIIKTGSLEELELSYKVVGLHLLFLYRLERQTEALYWERVREEVSDGVHESLSTEVKNIKKVCRNCRKPLPWNHSFQICDSCHSDRGRNRHNVYYHR